MEWTPINKDWPCRGELPDYHVEVLISIDDEVYTGWLHDDSYSWFVEGAGIFDIDEVDAWMPKPKPYKG